MTFLAKIGDCCYVLIPHITLKEHNKVFIGDMWRANLCSILVGIGYTNQLARDVFQTLLSLRIIP